MLEVVTNRSRGPGHGLGGTDVVEGPPGVDQLYDVTVAVDIHQTPQLLPGVNTREEDSLVLSVDSEDDVTSTTDVVIHH